MEYAEDILLRAYRSVDYITADDPEKATKLEAIRMLYSAWKHLAMLRLAGIRF